MLHRLIQHNSRFYVITAEPCFQSVCCCAAGEIECGRRVGQDVVAVLAGDVDDGVPSGCVAVEHDDVLVHAQGGEGVAGRVGAIQHIVHRGMRMGGVRLAHEFAPEGTAGEQGGAGRGEQGDGPIGGEGAMGIRQAVDDHRGRKLEHA